MNASERIRAKHWLRSLSDRELGDLARGIAAIDRVVKDYRKNVTDSPVRRRAAR